MFYPEGCAFRTVAEQALQDAQQNYKLVLSNVNGGIITSIIAAGNAIGVMAEGMMPDNFKMLPNDIGLPELPTAYIQLLEREKNLSIASEQVKQIKKNYQYKIRP